MGGVSVGQNLTPLAETLMKSKEIEMVQKRNGNGKHTVAAIDEAVHDRFKKFCEDGGVTQVGSAGAALTHYMDTIERLRGIPLDEAALLDSGKHDTRVFLNHILKDVDDINL